MAPAAAATERPLAGLQLMISYRKDEIDDLAHAVGRHWGGQACDWRLVLESTPRNASPTLELHVEIALGGFTRITTIPPLQAFRRQTPSRRATRHRVARPIL